MRISLFFIFSSLSSVSGLFSGFYSAKDSENYGGAFFISKSKLLQQKIMLERAWYPEGIIFSVIQASQFCNDCKTIFTRDYFDLSSDHLSSTTNIIGTMPMETQKRILKYLNNRLIQTVKSIKDSIPTSTTSSSSSSHNMTNRKKVVAIIPFSQVTHTTQSELEYSLYFRKLRIQDHNRMNTCDCINK
jgi:hypothetical protein